MKKILILFITVFSALNVCGQETMIRESFVSKFDNKPLIIVNGEPKPYEITELISASDVLTIDIFRGITANAIYGSKGVKNGTLMIVLKEGVKTPSEKDIADQENISKLKKMYIIDDVQMPYFVAKCLEPELIESVDVLKGEYAYNRYGEEGINGVFKIILKMKEGKQIDHLQLEGLDKSDARILIESTYGKEGKEKPLLIINHLSATYSVLDEINKTDIEKVYLQNDKSIKEQYGEKAKGGVVFIQLKKGVKSPFLFNLDPKDAKPIDPNPLIIIDGKEVPYSEMDKLDSEDIESMDIYKGEKAIDLYGEKGKHGVIKLKLKSGHNSSGSSMKINGVNKSSQVSSLTTIATNDNKKVYWEYTKSEVENGNSKNEFKLNIPTITNPFFNQSFSSTKPIFIGINVGSEKNGRIGISIIQNGEIVHNLNENGITKVKHTTAVSYSKGDKLEIKVNESNFNGNYSIVIYDNSLKDGGFLYWQNKADLKAFKVIERRTKYNGVRYEYQIKNVGNTVIPGGSYKVYFKVDGKTISFDKKTKEIKPGQVSTYSSDKTYYKMDHDYINYRLEIKTKDSNSDNNVLEGTTKL